MGEMQNRPVASCASRGGRVHGVDLIALMLQQADDRSRVLCPSQNLKLPASGVAALVPVLVAPAIGAGGGPESAGE